MGQFVNAFGTGGTLDWKGKTWKLSPVGKKAIQKRFELWMERRALDKAKELAKTMDTTDAAQLLQDARQDVLAGTFSFVSAQSGKAMQTQSGQIQLAYLLINDNHPEFTLEMAEEMGREQLEEIMKRIDDENSNPNSEAPASPGIQSTSTPSAQSS